METGFVGSTSTSWTGRLWGTGVWADRRCGLRGRLTRGGTIRAALAEPRSDKGVKRADRVDRVSDGKGVDDVFWALGPRRMSKTVCTIGPKTASVESIRTLASIGMNVVRLNMSHGTHEWHQSVIDMVREVNREGVYNLGLLLDTKGPEVRSGDLKEPLRVERGMEFIWTISKDRTNYPKMSTDVSYDDFVKDVKPGDILLVDGGICSFYVKEVTATDVITECLDSGLLTSRRHLNVRGKSASLPSITDKDWQDIFFGIKNGIDFYALSFVKHENDIRTLKEYMKSQNVEALILSKIESAEAVPRLQQILEVSDGAMVARGDLGAEVPVEEVPLIQDEIVRINRSLKKPTIVATHMLESMINYPTPTRAEVTDIAEAVKQGADATMLSGETASGAYPDKALTVMCTVAQSVCNQKVIDDDGSFYEQYNPVPFGVAGDKIGIQRANVALAAATLARDLKATAIVVFTRRGNYTREISAARPRCPIISFCPSEDLRRRLTLFWGVHSYVIEFSEDPEETIKSALEAMSRGGLVASRDVLVIVSDILVGSSKHAVNSVQVRTVR
mmetsp:Transcript_13309/g.27041  ORF Transcript_13309/g.27041 Transcript_13309/m.27041 type:complete len:561 (-) Transcript_13309:3614-5296(-)